MLQLLFQLSRPDGNSNTAGSSNHCPPCGWEGHPAGSEPEDLPVAISQQSCFRVKSRDDKTVFIYLELIPEAVTKKFLLL
jgi:hypothetical protein